MFSKGTGLTDLHHDRDQECFRSLLYSNIFHKIYKYSRGIWTSCVVPMLSLSSGITMALNGFVLNENHGGIKEREHARPTLKITAIDGLCLQLHVTSGLICSRSCNMMLEGSRGSGWARWSPDLLTGVYLRGRKHSHTPFSFHSLLQRVHQKALNPSRAHSTPTNLVFYSPCSATLPLFPFVPLQTLSGSSRPVAQPGPKTMAELQEMETTTRGGGARRRRRRRRRRGFILLSDLWSGWQQDGPFFVVFVWVEEAYHFKKKKKKEAVPESKSE